jgi:hypothetical protein
VSGLLEQMADLQIERALCVYAVVWIKALPQHISPGGGELEHDCG